MRKKIPCKVINSISLSDNSLFESSPNSIFSNDMNIVTFHAAPGMFTYDGQLQKAFVSTEDASIAKILDCYV